MKCGDCHQWYNDDGSLISVCMFDQVERHAKCECKHPDYLEPAKLEDDLYVPHSTMDTRDLYKPQTGSDLELKPCPFCGGTEVVYFRYEHLAGDRYGVLCCDCMASIDPGWAQQKSTVQEMWNRRAQ